MKSVSGQLIAQASPPKAKSLPPDVRQWLSEDSPGTAKGKSQLPGSAKAASVVPAKAAAAPVEKPQKPQWSCQITSAPRQPEKGFTVGEVFTLGCQGDELELVEPLSLKLPEDKEYSLVLLKKLEVTKTKISYEVTSYRTGKLEFPFLDFVDAKGGGFISQPLQHTVASVLPQPPPESPYGPVAPLPMGWPVWLFFAVVVCFLVILGWFGLFLRRRIQRKNLEQNIRKFLSPMGSYHQFSKDIRKLRSGVLFSDRHEWTMSQVENYIVQLNEHFRMFLLREFTVPATTWTSRQTQKEIRGKAKYSYSIFSESLRKALQELDRAMGSHDKMTSRDCDQLTKMVMKTVDLVWSCKNKGRRS